MNALIAKLRKCSKCAECKPVAEFYKHRSQPGGLNVWCKDCYKAYAAKNAHKKKAYAKQYYSENAEETKQRARDHRKVNGAEIRASEKQKHRKDPRAKMLKGARVRAKIKNLKFELTVADILIPKICPLLGILITVGAGKHCAGSPTIDRRDAQKDYVPGNVWVISHRANSIKRDATIQELRTLTTNLERELNGP